MISSEEETTTAATPVQQEEATPKPKMEPFSWESATNDAYSKDERAKLEAQYDKTLNIIADHAVVEGTVVALTGKDAVINIGFKSDGLVPLTEFRHMPDLKVGDNVEVYVETQEDKDGQLIL